MLHVINLFFFSFVSDISLRWMFSVPDKHLHHCRECFAVLSVCLRTKNKQLMENSQESTFFLSVGPGNNFCMKYGLSKVHCTFSISSFFSLTRAILSCERPRTPPRSAPSTTPFIPPCSRVSNGDRSRRIARLLSTLSAFEAKGQNVCTHWHGSRKRDVFFFFLSQATAIPHQFCLGVFGNFTNMPAHLP